VTDKPRIVIDTNVLIAALRSDAGSSNRLFLLIGQGYFDFCLSNSLALEYEEVSQRLDVEISWTRDDVGDLLDFLYGAALRANIHFKWPVLPDPDDNMILELAVAAQCQYIVTFNRSDFAGVEQFGIQICTPFEFLQLLQPNP
jgi:putative PIN family toxin of toxin-antitoxin system